MLSFSSYEEEQMMTVWTLLGTHHEAERTGVDVGVIHAAVHFIGVVPVCRALVFMTEPLCL